MCHHSARLVLINVFYKCYCDIKLHVDIFHLSLHIQTGVLCDNVFTCSCKKFHDLNVNVVLDVQVFSVCIINILSVKLRIMTVESEEFRIELSKFTLA